MKRIVVTLFVALTLLGPAVGAAVPAAGSVKWKVLSDQNAVGQTGVLRFGQKTLVSWTRQRAGKYDLMATVIAANGTLTTQAIVSGWDGIGDSVLVPTKNGGARVIFNGAKKNSLTKLNGMNTATTPPSLASWTLLPQSIAVDNQAYVRPPSATVAKDFTPLTAFQTEGFDLALHRGLDSKTADAIFDSSASCCVEDPNLATDRVSSGITMAWCASSERANGVFTQGVDPATGQPLGKKTLLGGSAAPSGGRGRKDCPEAQRIGMAARKGGGVYVAAATGFPTATKVLVWKLGQKNPMTATSSSSGHSDAALSADGDGHVWVTWLEATGGAQTIGVRRTDAQGAAFGAVTEFAGPPANFGVYNVNVAAVPGGAWVIARALLQNGKNVIYYTKIAG